MDLPAPFSPSSAWISPGAQLEIDAAQRLDAAEPLGRVGHGKQGRGHSFHYSLAIEKDAAIALSPAANVKPHPLRI